MPVKHAEQGTPIVSVLKPDEAMHICSDHELTVNQCSSLGRYPLRRFDGLYASLDGGGKITKIDLSLAYSQIEHDESFRPHTMITTHAGPSLYTRSIFGMKSAAGIFIRITDNVVEDVTYT